MVKWQTLCYMYMCVYVFYYICIVCIFVLYVFYYNLKISLALAGVAQWIDCWTANQRVSSSIPSQGTCLGCGPGPCRGAPEATAH